MLQKRLKWYGELGKKANENKAILLLTNENQKVFTKSPRALVFKHVLAELF